MEQTRTTQVRDGKSRVYDEKGTLISVDGEPVKKDAPATTQTPEKKEGGKK